MHVTSKTFRLEAFFGDDHVRTGAPECHTLKSAACTRHLRR